MRVAAAIAITTLLASCASQVTCQEEHLTIESAAYSTTFDQAIRSLRKAGYKPVVVDRDSGLIETAPRHAGGVLEPWRTDNDSLEQAAANTASSQRRRIRVEFVPAGYIAPAPIAPAELGGPPIPGSDASLARADMAHFDGAIEMRVWVGIERSVNPGQNLSSYSGSLASRWTDPEATSTAVGDSAAVLDKSNWTSVGRDQQYERRVLGLILAGDPPAK